MHQQHILISLNQSIDQETNYIPNNCLELKRKLKRKLSQIYKRIAEQTNQNLTTMQNPIEKTTQSQAKVYRKDTIETKQTLAQSTTSQNILPENQKINELISKSQNDPFLKRKLKTILEDDLKNLMKLNQKNYVTENFGSQTERTQKNIIDRLSSSQVIQSEYKNIPKDISIILNDSVLLRRSDPGKRNKQEATQSEERIFQDFTDEEQKILKNNQKALKQQFTTLRKENYKNKIARIQSFRSVQEKQRAITEMALSRFVDKKNIKKYGHIKKNSFGENKQKVQK